MCKKGIIILLSVFYIVQLYAQQPISIDNEYLKLEVSRKNISLSSKACPDLQVRKFTVVGSVTSYSKKEVTDEKWGKGTQVEVKYNNGKTLFFTLYSGDPFVQIHTVLANTTPRDVALRDLSIASVDMSIADMPETLNSLGTGGLTPASHPKGSFLYQVLSNPVDRHSILMGWLTQRQGVGYMVPSWNKTKKTYVVETGLEFGNYLLKSNTQRGTDTLLIGLFADGINGLEMYGNVLAKEYNIKLPERPEVYCTWYHRNITKSGASTEKALKENAEFAQKQLAPFGLNTFQIDDHWQSSMIDGLTYQNQNKFKGARVGSGPLKTFAESNFNFPLGMAATAKNMNERGFVAGIWFMPFAGDINNPYFDKEIFAKRLLTGEAYEARNWSGTCIDATNPKGESFLRKRFKRIYDWGYRYFKIDGLHTGAPSENVYVQRTYDGNPVYADATIHDSDKTFTQCFRKGLGILKEEAPEAFLLGCTVTQNMSAFAPSFGYVDAMRVGPDNDKAHYGEWDNLTRGADFSGNLFFLNNRVWYNDPDPYYVRIDNPLHKARWMVSWQSVAGVMSTTSMQYSELPAERLNLIKRGLPTHNLNARPIDILENEKPRIWLVSNDRMHIIGLFNWKEKETENIRYDLKKMGLESEQGYEMFDFWDNKYLGKITGKLSLDIDSASCRILAVRSVKEYPQVISTSRHITQGLMDIVAESWNKSSKSLDGRSEVVENDIYELRVAVPDTYKVRKALCNGKPMKVTTEKGLVRLTFIPQKTGTVDWNIIF